MPDQDHGRLLPQLAEWVAALRPEDIPERINQVAASQILSMLAAAASGRLTEDGVAALRALQRTGAGGSLPCVGGGTAALLDAIDLHATWSMTQDYDDYMFMGHTGHSSVWTALFVGAHVGATAEEFYTAIAVGNELGGRLGASLLLGPHNGQMWVPIHRLAAAAITGRLLGLAPARIADAMGTALYNANDPVFRGFMGPGSKVRSAASPTVAGVRAALMAAEGLSGAHDILEHPQGFWRRFTYAPILGTFRGLGRNWAADTLAVKPYPGCAYLDTTVDALLQCLTEFQERHGRPPTAVDVVRVEVEAGALTVGMNALSAGAVAEGLLSPVVVNFSIPLTVAVTLVSNGLTGADVTQSRLDAHADAIRKIATKVDLRHNAHYSVALLRAFDELLPLHVWLRGIPLRTLLRLRRRARRDMGAHVDRGVPSRGVRGTLTRDDRRFLLRTLFSTLGHAVLSAARKDKRSGPPLDEIDFREIKLLFPARVALHTQGGTFHAESTAPPGVSYNGTLHPTADEKFVREVTRVATRKAPAALISEIRDRRITPQALLDNLSSE